MDKKTFISELRRALSVLQEDELNDIVNEYEQHIDMKMKNGLTEDEAIADFGSLTELTADILEAYHVRADYAADSKKEKKSLLREEGSAGKELWQQTGKTCRAAGTQAVRGLRGLSVWLWGVLMFVKRQLVKPVLWGKRLGERWKEKRQGKKLKDGSATVSQEAETMEAMEPSAADRRLPALSSRRRFGRLLSDTMHGITSAGGGICGLIAGGFRLCVRLAVWSARMAWNLAWIGVALFCAVNGLIFLFLFGLLAVLWMQHYPLTGVTIGCLGLVMCAFSVAGLSMTLLRGKKHRKTEETAGGQHA